MQVSVHCVVLIIEQPFLHTDDRLPVSQPEAGCRNWAPKQQKHQDKSS